MRTVAQLRRAPHRILTSGGADKIDAIQGALRLLRPTVLVTDEATAATLLANATAAAPFGSAPRAAHG